MMAVPHIGFILAAYALTAVTMVGMVATIVMDGRSVRRALDRLDPRRGAATTSGRAGETRNRPR